MMHIANGYPMQDMNEVSEYKNKVFTNGWVRILSFTCSGTVLNGSLVRVATAQERFWTVPWLDVFRNY